MSQRIITGSRTIDTTCEKLLFGIEFDEQFIAPACKPRRLTSSRTFICLRSRPKFDEWVENIIPSLEKVNTVALFAPMGVSAWDIGIRESASHIWFPRIKRKTWVLILWQNTGEIT